MTFISVERVIARPPRTVIDFVAAHHFQNHPKWYGQLAAEDANLNTALTLAAEDRDAETLLRLCGGLWQFWQTRGELTVGTSLAGGRPIHSPVGQ